MASGRAVPGPPLRIVEQGAQGLRQLAHVTRSHQVGTEPVGTDDLGDAPARDTTSGVAVAISSTVGSEKPS